MARSGRSTDEKESEEVARFSGNRRQCRPQLLGVKPRVARSRGGRRGYENTGEKSVVRGAGVTHSVSGRDLPLGCGRASASPGADLAGAEQGVHEQAALPLAV